MPAIAIEGPDLVGVPVMQVLQQFREQGLPLAWSSSLVQPDMLVRTNPPESEAQGLITHVLAPHGLELLREEGIWFVVRRGSSSAEASQDASLLIILRDADAQLIDVPAEMDFTPASGTVEPLGLGVYRISDMTAGSYRITVQAAGYRAAIRGIVIRDGQQATLPLRLETAPTQLEDLNVSASRYVLLSNSQFFIDQRAIQNLPDIGDDPIRSAHRLPGTAAGGWSARSHFRGGEESETAIYLNGLKLLDPFHVRDFHNVFSSIDQRVVAGMEAYTGGFPVAYGESLSGVLLLQSQQADRPRRFEIGVSVFNTSLLAAGFSETGSTDWLVSARRSNLDLVLDPEEQGEPSYNDVFAELGLALSPETQLTLNALRASDSVLVITENKPDDEEFSVSDTLNLNVWAQLENSWTLDLSSQTVLSWSDFSNDQRARANDPEQLIGDVLDRREVSILGIRQDWTWTPSDRHRWRWGWEYRREKADYDYQSAARYFGSYLAFPGVPEFLVRDIQAAPRGDSWSLHVWDRWQMAPATTLDLGLRWDRQNWQGPASGDQLSPRFNLLHQVNEQFELRLTWGRFFQSQGIHELQVEDGVERFFPAQQADHTIAGVRKLWNGGLSLRIEGFLKDYRQLRPRYENLLDPLPLIPELEPDRIRIAPQSARSRGVEVTVEKDQSADFRWWASYSWSRVEDRIDGRDELRNWDQRHSVQAGAAWESGAWQLGAAVKYHTGWPTTSARLLENAATPEIVFGPRNAENLNAFFNLDVRAAYVWPLSRGQLTAFVEIANLTNRKNECCVDYDIEESDEGALFLERSVDHWLGITPAIGVLWEF